MRPPSLACLVVLTQGLALACGGEIAASGDDAGTHGMDIGSGDESATTADDSSTTDAPTNVVACTMGAGNAAAGPNGACSIVSQESCSDGAHYTATCSCPAATCACDQASPTHSSARIGVAYPYCSQNCRDPVLGFEACGFPMP
jgi:hypothetical protein